MNKDRLLKLNIKASFSAIGIIMLAAIVSPIISLAKGSYAFMFIAMEIIILVCGLLFKWSNNRNNPDVVYSFRFDGRKLTKSLICIFLISSMIMIGSLFSYISYALNFDFLGFQLGKVDRNNIFIVLVACSILPGICEEITFRYCFFKELAKFNILLALVSSSIIFLVFHVGLMCPYYFYTGIVFAGLYMITGNLATNIIYHSIFNGTNIVFYYFKLVSLKLIYIRDTWFYSTINYTYLHVV